MNRRCFIQMGCYMLVCLFLAISTASARVCFLPDSTDCGEGEVVSGSGNVVVPCKYKEAKDVPLNSAYQEPYKSGMCYYARCKISQSTCEENNGKNKKCCNFDSASGCYYMGDCPPEECPADYKYSSQQAADRESVNNCSCSPCPTDATKWKCTCPEKCENIKPVGTYASKCDDSQIKEEATGIIGSDGQCYTCKDKPVEKNCSDINKFYKSIKQVSQCENYEPVKGVSAADGQCYKCTIDNCFGKESKIYYVTYGQYLQGHVAYQSTCKCSSYLVKGNSPNSRPIKTTAISTPGGGSSSTEKIKLPTILTGVSSSNPYSVKIEEYNCFGDDHCSAQAVKFDVFEKYAPDTAKSLKEDDYFFNGDGVATTFKEGLYFYTGRQLKPKSISINTCDDYVVILGSGNPKACAQINSDYYNYYEACPKGLEKKIVPNKYDSTGAQCYTCEKPAKSTVTFAFVRQDCPSPHKGENRVAWLENGKLKYKTIDGSGEVPYSDEYVVLANVYVDSTAQRGALYQEPLVYELDADVMCAETSTGTSRSECLKTQGTDLQYTQMFVGYPSGDNNIFPSLSTESTMTPFEGGGYGLLLRMHGAEKRTSYTVKVSCESQCKASQYDDWHACYYGRRASGHYDCKTCK